MIGFAGNLCPSAPCSQVLQVQCHKRSPKAPGQAHCCLLMEEGGPAGHKQPWLLGQRVTKPGLSLCTRQPLCSGKQQPSHEVLSGRGLLHKLLCVAPVTHRQVHAPYCAPSPLKLCPQLHHPWAFP